jgi:hypothetical protein
MNALPVIFKTDELATEVIGSTEGVTDVMK